MRNRWKRLAVVFGAAVLVVCQNGMIQVKAAELPATEQSLTQESGGEDVKAAEETGLETEAVDGENVEKGAEEGDSAELQSEDVNENQKEGTLLPAEELS